MTGLEKIIAQIQDEAAAACTQVSQTAQAQCDDILSACDRECDGIAQDCRAQCEAIRTEVLARGESAAQMQRKNRLLAEKQALIAQVIDSAKNELANRSDVDYFVLIGRLAEKYAHAGDGIMYLSAADLGRIPAYFARRVQEIGQAKGGTLTLSQEPGAIENGFLLSYGGIEENCSFSALIEADKERLSDLVRSRLFP